MKKYEQILIELEKDIINFIIIYPELEHLLWDTFKDHQNRYKSDLAIINKFFKKGKILEIGASPYNITYCLKKLGYKVISLDINPKLLSKFIDKYNLNVINCDIENSKLPFKNNSFNYVIFNEVFEHLRINPIHVLKEINRILKRNGLMMLTTPNLYALHKILMFNLGQSFNDGFDEFEKLNTYGYVGHIREYSTKEMMKFLERTGFKVLNISYRSNNLFFKYSGFTNFFQKAVGLIIDLLMMINPFWRRDQIIIAKKEKLK